jgi:hypothetical protein
MQILQDFKVEGQKSLGFTAGVSEFAVCKGVSDGKKMIGDALHGGDDDGDVGAGCGAADQTRRVEHALRAQQRAAAKLEGHNIQRLGGRRAGAMHGASSRGTGTGEVHAMICCYTILNIFETHDLGSWFFPSATPVWLEPTRWSVSGGGLKEETHRQFRFWRWVGNFLLVR